MPEILLTVPEAAGMLGVAPSTIYSWKDEGKIVPERHRGSLRIPLREVRRIQDERRLFEATYSVEDVSMKLRISDATARRMCRDTFERRKFYFRCVPSRKGWRIFKDSFNEYLERSSNAAR